MLRRTPWIIFSLFALSGCGIKRPNIRVEIINAPAGHPEAAKRCGYNLANDYDDNGNIIPGHKPKCFPNVQIGDLNKALLIDADEPDKDPEHFASAIAEFKTYIKLLREKYQNGCKPLPEAQ